MLNTRNLKVWGALLVTMSCVGCGGVPVYTDYAGPDAAKLRIALNDPKHYFLWTSFVDLSTCKASAFLKSLGGDSGADTARIGMLDEKPIDNGNVERHVQGGQNTTMQFSSLAVSGVGDVLLGLTPDKQSEVRDRTPSKCPMVTFPMNGGQQYEVDVAVGPQKCEVAVYELSISEGELKRSRMEFIVQGCPPK